MADLTTANTPAWQVQLHGLGFHAPRKGAAIRNDRAVFALRSGWGVIESRRRVGRPDALGGQLGRPGLWKCVGGERRRAVRRIFELPPWLMPGAARSRRLHVEDAAEVFREVVRWALETEQGVCRDGWIPPPLEEVLGYMPEHGLTLETGEFARQGTLHHCPDRLALEFQILSSIPEDLSVARRAWLDELLRDAQDRWRLVRIGLTDESALRAEVDLTGAPHSVLAPLAQVALDALRFVVSWLVEPADLLVRRTVECRALEIRHSRAQPAGGDGS
jgi:hypothetical protein